MDEISQYTKINQIELAWLRIKKPDAEAPLEITDLMEEFIIHEDLFQSSISAKLVFSDQVNLVGTLPIIGGEIVSIKFKTPARADFRELSFRVYRVGERELGNDSSNFQYNILYLCTEEVWWAAANDIGNGFQGTYSDVVDKLLKLSNTKKVLDKTDSQGLVTFVSPQWNMFKGLKFCADRASSSTDAPFFFWETVKGYKFKDLKTLYDASVFKRVYIEDRTVSGADGSPEKVFNSVYSFEYLESNDRLYQETHSMFGENYIELNPVTKVFSKKNVTYDDFFKKDIHIEGFPLNDDFKKVRNKTGFVAVKADGSSDDSYVRNSAIGFMDNVKLMISIPGDSDLDVGQNLWVEIPSKAALVVDKEEHTSGKWLVRSIKHLIQRKTYTQICELTKDSFAANVRKDS